MAASPLGDGTGPLKAEWLVAKLQVQVPSCRMGPSVLWSEGGEGTKKKSNNHSDFRGEGRLRAVALYSNSSIATP